MPKKQELAEEEIGWNDPRPEGGWTDPFFNPIEIIVPGAPSVPHTPKPNKVKKAKSLFRKRPDDE